MTKSVSAMESAFGKNDAPDVENLVHQEVKNALRPTEANLESLMEMISKLIDRL